MALQEMHDLEGAALEFAENKGYGPPCRGLQWVDPTPPRRVAVPALAGHVRGHPRLVEGDAHRPRGPDDERRYAYGMGGFEPCQQRPRRGQRAR